MTVTRFADVERAVGSQTGGADLLEQLKAVAPRILPYTQPVWERLDQARRAVSRILFEGAQGAMLVSTTAPVPT